MPKSFSKISSGCIVLKLFSSSNGAYYCQVETVHFLIREDKMTPFEVERCELNSFMLIVNLYSKITL